MITPNSQGYEAETVSPQLTRVDVVWTKGPQLPKLTNAQLLKLANCSKPPQAWYDEETNRFRGKRQRG